MTAKIILAGVEYELPPATMGRLETIDNALTAQDLGSVARAAQVINAAIGAPRGPLHAGAPAVPLAELTEGMKVALEHYGFQTAAPGKSRGGGAAAGLNFDLIYGELATAFGYTPDQIRSLTVADYQRFGRYWAERPPVQAMLQHFLGYKPAEKPAYMTSEAARDWLAKTGGNIPGVERRPASEPVQSFLRDFPGGVIRNFP